MKQAQDLLALMRETSAGMQIAGIPRVSDILQPIVNYSRVPADVLEKARDRGTRCASLVEDWAGGMNPLPDDDLIPYMESFLAFTETDEYRGWRNIHELKLGYSGEDGELRGTTDLLQFRPFSVKPPPAVDSGAWDQWGGAIEGRIIDFKTTYSPRPSHRIQVVLYSAMVEYMLREHKERFSKVIIKDPLIVYLQRDGSPPKAPRSIKGPRPGDLQGAKSLLWIHKFRWQTDSQYRNDLTQSHSYEFDAEVPMSNLIPGDVDLTA